MCFVCALSVLSGTGVLGGGIGADAPSKMPIFCSAGVDGPSGCKAAVMECVGEKWYESAIVDAAPSVFVLVHLK